MLIVCFEDTRVEQLRPITLARPAYRISCAGFRLLDWLQTLLDELPKAELAVHIRTHLRELGRQSDQVGAPEISADQPLLLVNARLAPTVENYQRLRKAAHSGSGDNPAATSTCAFDVEDGSLLWCLDQARVDGQGELESLDGVIERVTEAAFAEGDGQRPPLQHQADVEVFRRPHDVVAIHMRNMAASVQAKIDAGSYRQLQDGLFVGDGVTIGNYASIDTSDGPILLESGVDVGPFCYLSGPVFAGAKTRVIEHSSLKDGVSLGHTVKIGGEVEASVIEPYSNKQHHGFLGHSYLGSWINLGAGTCNSDLKNTYGKINVDYGDEKVATGMQFFGCVMGDYSKTAINTSIFTGKIIGVCSMMYGFVTSNVPSYVNYARLFGQTSLLPTEVMISTQARMFARRRVEQRECDKQLIRDMYKLTAKERAADADLL